MSIEAVAYVFRNLDRWDISPSALMMLTRISDNYHPEHGYMTFHLDWLTMTTKVKRKDMPNVLAELSEWGIVHVARLDDEEVMLALPALRDEYERQWSALRAEQEYQRQQYRKREISKGKRATVFARDDYRCVQCDADSDLCVDHIYPERFGGTADLDNLQTLCRSCNSRKGIRLPEDSLN